MLSTHLVFYNVELSVLVQYSMPWSGSDTIFTHSLIWEVVGALDPVHTFVIAAFAVGQHAVITERMFIKHTSLIYNEHHKYSDLWDNSLTCLDSLLHFPFGLFFRHENAWIS